MQSHTQLQPPGGPTGNWVAALRGFLGTGQAAVARCELCGNEISHEHVHLVEPATRRLLCACQACGILFDSPVAKQYRRVPSQAVSLHDLELTDQQWDAFMIPINMAFFFNDTNSGGIVAQYPGPAGATESTLDLEAWDDLVTANPQLNDIQADVEALLINRVGGAREYYRVPIDRCYALVGQIRTHWHGLSGGSETRDAIQNFFAALRAETGHPIHNDKDLN